MTQLRIAASLEGRYAIQREIGAGGMATVYLAEDVRHRRNVAIKVLHPELSALLGPDRFLNEIELTASLQHPHILPLFDSGSADGLLWYAMPFVEGETLRGRLEHERQLPVADAVRLACEVADALAYAHGRGVVHRDVKPENILLQGGHALVADFGIALAVHHAGGQRMTQTGMSLGTPQYMAPEQAMGERNVDARADVYALGAITYEMLAGVPPFTGPTAQAIVAKVLTERPRPVRELRETVSEQVEAAIEHALQKLPADRFETAAAFASALRNETVEAGRYRSATAAASTPDSTRKQQRLTFGLGAALVVMTVATASLALRTSSAPVQVHRATMKLDTGQTMDLGTLEASHDGTALVYSGTNEQIFVKRSNEILAKPLAGDARGWSPFLSPDGKFVGVITASPGDLIIAPIAGGAVTRLVKDSAFSVGGAWSKSGIIYFSSASGSLLRVRTDGSDLQLVAQNDSTKDEIAFSFPDLLPSEKSLLAIVSHKRSPPDVVIIDIASGTRQVLTAGVFARYVPTGHLLVVHTDGKATVVPFDASAGKITGDARELPGTVALADGGGAIIGFSGTGTLYYAPGNSSVGQVMRVSRNGVAHAIDNDWRDNLQHVSLSPDGSRIAVTKAVDGRTEVWVKQLDAGPLTRVGVGIYFGYRPGWAPDSRDVTFIGDVGGAQVYAGVNALLKRNAGTSGSATMLAFSKRGIDEGLLSPDGKWIVARVGVGGNRDLYVMQVGVDSVMRPLISTAAQESSPAISPDGKWIAFVSDESGRRQVYVSPFPNAESGHQAVSTSGGSEPAWSADGKELFFKSSGYMKAVRIGGLTTDGLQLSAPVDLFPVTDFYADANHTSYSVSRDGQFYMVRWPNDFGEKLVMVIGWFEELKTMWAK